MPLLVGVPLDDGGDEDGEDGASERRPSLLQRLPGRLPEVASTLGALSGRLKQGLQELHGQGQRGVDALVAEGAALLPNEAIRTWAGRAYSACTWAYGRTFLSATAYTRAGAAGATHGPHGGPHGAAPASTTPYHHMSA